MDLAGDGREDDFGCGDGEVIPMMFANAEEIEPDLIGERALLDDVTERCGLRQLLPMVIDSDISKRVETQFNRLRHLGALSLEVEAGSRSRNPPELGRVRCWSRSMTGPLTR